MIMSGLRVFVSLWLADGLSVVPARAVGATGKLVEGF